MTALAIIATGIVAYLLGRAHGWMSAVRFLGSPAPIEEPDPWIEAQRENAPLQ